MESKLFKNNMASTDRKNKNTHPYHNMAAIPPPSCLKSTFSKIPTFFMYWMIKMNKMVNDAA